MEFQRYLRAAEHAAARFGTAASVAAVLGSGLGGYADRLEIVDRLRYAEIPGFPLPTNPAHRGEMILAKTRSGRPVILLSGRIHVYEGRSMEEAAFFVRVLYLMGVKTLIVTNAAGAVDPAFEVGDLMLVEDHVKFCAESPAAGPHIPEFGERFFDMSNAYTPRLRETALRLAEKCGVALRRGVYWYFAGPQYETPAEIRAAALLGAGAVGMSTVPEVIAAAQCKMRVLALSLLTNRAAGTGAAELSDEEVRRVAAACSDKIGRLLDEILDETAAEEPNPPRTKGCGNE